jgi:hypothetical protein
MSSTTIVIARTRGLLDINFAPVALCQSAITLRTLFLVALSAQFWLRGDYVWNRDYALDLFYPASFSVTKYYFFLGMRSYTMTYNDNLCNRRLFDVLDNGEKTFLINS